MEEGLLMNGGSISLLWMPGSSGGLGVVPVLYVAAAPRIEIFLSLSYLRG